MSLLHDIRLLLTRWSTTFILLSIFAIAMAGATLIEANMNIEAARGIIYNAWWFNLLLLMMLLNFIFIGQKLQLLKRKRWGALLLHYGFGVMLAGAFVTHAWGFEGYMHIREGESSDRMMTESREVLTLPFTVTLNHFTLTRYHGSQSPSSYESDVTIYHKGTTRRQPIFMNNIAQVGGYRLYQSSYDPDERGTILSVNHDPVGTALSYMGYFLLIAGMVVALCQKGSRLRRLYAQLGKTTWLLAITLASATTLSAQPTASEANRFGTLLLQSSDGRIEPVDSYASEILRKLYHADTYHGLHANQVLVGILTDRAQWSQEPIIYLGNNPLPEGVVLPGKYTSLSALFDTQNRYLLQELVGTLYAKAPADRTKPEQALLKLDEKVNILYALLQGELLPIFPVAGHSQWLSPGNNLSRIAPADSAQITHLFSAFQEAVSQNNAITTAQAIDQIAQYQRARMPSLHPGRIKAEILYNRADLFRWAFRGYLILGGVLLAVTLWEMFDRKRHLVLPIITGSIFTIFAIHTLGLILRTYISGHAPWTNAYESMVYVAWATVLSGVIFARRSRLALALATLLGGVILFVSNLNWLDPQITPLVPVLKSYWLMIHVSVITASYGFFGICAACGITSLVATIAGKNLSELRIINELAMIIGLVLLTTGIFFGAVWANESWGRYWGWDPKETWALITMVVYAMITHLHFLPLRHTKTLVFDVCSVIGFATVLMTFFGVNYYLSGLHSYGSNEGMSSTVIWMVSVAVVALIVIATLRTHKTTDTL